MNISAFRRQASEVLLEVSSELRSLECCKPYVELVSDCAELKIHIGQKKTSQTSLELR